MALDYEAALVTIDQLQGKIGQVRTLVAFAREGKYMTSHIADLDFTVAQKDELIAKYDTLKSELQAIYSQLP